MRPALHAVAQAPPVDRTAKLRTCGQAVDAADPEDPDDPEELEEDVDEDDEDDDDDDAPGVEAGFEPESDLPVELPVLDLLFAAARESVR